MKLEGTFLSPSLPLDGLVVYPIRKGSNDCSDFVGISDTSKTSSINRRKYFTKNLSAATFRVSFVKKRGNIKRHLLWNTGNRA